MNETAVFHPFGPVHGATVVVAAVTCILLPLGMRACRSRALRLRVGQALGLALLGHEVLKTGLLVFGYGLPLTQSLPLHLCGVSVFLTAWVLLGRKYRAYEVVYFWGLGGSITALATPDLQHDFPHPLFLSFFVGHTLVLLGVTYATVVYGFRPLPRSLILAMVVSLAYLGLMFFLNLALGTNYLYLRAKPTQPSLLDYLGPWPWYIAGMVVMGAAIMLLCYAPFAIGDWRRRRRDAGWT